MMKVHIGGQETYYLHCPRFYIPTMAIQTWSRYECGIGIFTMQGYEQGNKESKIVWEDPMIINNRRLHKIEVAMG